MFLLMSEINPFPPRTPYGEIICYSNSFKSTGEILRVTAHMKFSCHHFWMVQFVFSPRQIWLFEFTFCLWRILGVKGLKNGIQLPKSCNSSFSRSPFIFFTTTSLSDWPVFFSNCVRIWERSIWKCIVTIILLALPDKKCVYRVYALNRYLGATKATATRTSKQTNQQTKNNRLDEELKTTILLVHYIFWYTSFPSLHSPRSMAELSLTSALVTITRATVLLFDLSSAFSNTSAKYKGGLCAQRTENNQEIINMYC